MRAVVRWEVPASVSDDSFLTEGERSRCDALRSDVDRARFVARRWFVRLVVAEAAGCSPATVVIEQRCVRCAGPHGRPVARTPSRRKLHVSWSSVGDVTAVAVDRAPIGVDVVAGPPLLEWARLEAALKATGHGLDVDPSLVTVSAKGVERWDGPGRRPRVRIVDLVLEEGLVGAVATRRRWRGLRGVPEARARAATDRAEPRLTRRRPRRRAPGTGRWSRPRGGVRWPIGAGW